MKRLKRILMFLFVAALCSGFSPFPANAEDLNYSQKIVTFHDDVAWEDILDYAEEWGAQGVLILKELQIINAMVLRVPQNISTSDLTDDPRVAGAEDDQAVKLQSELQGHFASFIEPAPRPPSDHYPWSILKLYDQYYDPWFLTSGYERDDLPDLVRLALDRTESEEIKIAVFDTGIFYLHKNLFNVVKGGIDLINKDRTRKWNQKFRKISTNVEIIDTTHAKPFIKSRILLLT